MGSRDGGMESGEGWGGEERPWIYLYVIRYLS